MCFVWLDHNTLTVPAIKVTHEVIIFPNLVVIQDVKLHTKADNNPMNLIKKYFKDKSISLLSRLD